MSTYSLHSRGVSSARTEVSPAPSICTAPALAWEPGQPASLLSADVSFERKGILQLFSAVPHLYIDTCVLMNPGFELFWKRYSDDFRRLNIRLFIIPQVMMELARKTADTNAEVRRLARKALYHIVAPRNESLFEIATLSTCACHADPVFCGLMFAHHLHEHQILLTNDHGLISDVCNFCCSDSSKSSYETHTFSLSPQGTLFRPQISRLTLSPLVTLPACAALRLHQQTNPSAPPLPQYQFVLPQQSKKVYFHRALCSRITYISRAALQELIDRSKAEHFFRNLKRLQSNNKELRLQVLDCSLTPSLRQQLQRWMHLLNIQPALSPDMSEEDALLAATSLLVPKQSQPPQLQSFLLISQSTNLYARLLSRAPISYTARRLWNVCVTADGFFLRAEPVPPYLPQAASLAAA